MLMEGLFDQPTRNRRFYSPTQLEKELETLLDISRKYKVPIADIIQLKIALEMERSNNAYVDNGDAWDEHMEGISQLLETLIEKIEGIRVEVYRLADNSQSST